MFTFRNVASLTLTIGLLALVGCAENQQKIKTLEDENVALCQDKEILNADLAATKSDLQHCQSELAETQAASKQVLDKANKLAEQAAQLEKDLAAAKRKADANAEALAEARAAHRKAVSDAQSAAVWTNEQLTKLKKELEQAKARIAELTKQLEEAAKKMKEKEEKEEEEEPPPEGP